MEVLEVVRVLVALHQLLLRCFVEDSFEDSLDIYDAPLFPIGRSRVLISCNH